MKTLLTTLLITITSSLFAQEIPVGSCGILYFYDATGARTKRIYFCNNGSSSYPLGRPAANTTAEFQSVEALYPNPTSGVFYITFSEPLLNAPVVITDVNGKKINELKVSGKKIELNLSFFAKGVYFIQINDKGKLISKKVIKG